MKEIKKEVTTEQVVYEITKEELESIKIEERNKGRYDIIEYLCFAASHYIYKINIGGAVNFITDLSDFLSDKTNIIPNVYGYSFFEWMKKYR